MPWHYVVINQLIFVFIFYANYFVLVPLIIKIDRYFSFLRWVVFSLSLMYITFGIWWQILGKNDFTNIIGIVTTLGHYTHLWFFIGGVALAMRMAYDWQRNVDKNETLLTKKTNMELQFLKSNINLPFFETVLKKLKEISSRQANLVDEPILQLSNVLRYSLYYTDNHKIKVAQELEIIEDYINLVNLTYENLNIKFVNKIGSDLDTIPNLLVRVFGNWVHQNNEYSGTATITLSNIKDTITLTFPLHSNKIDLLMDTEHFEILQLEVPSGLQVSIIPLKYHKAS